MVCLCAGILSVVHTFHSLTTCVALLTSSTEILVILQLLPSTLQHILAVRFTFVMPIFTV